MTSKEVVLRAVEFRGMERLPLARGADADVVSVGCGRARDFTPSTPGMDEWGCVWKSLRPEQGDKGQVVAHPLEDKAAFATYRFPDPHAPGRMDAAREWLRANEALAREKFVVASMGSGPMHRLDYLRGFENYLVDLMDDPDFIQRLIAGIFAYLEGLVEECAPLNPDAVFMVDDQASQSGPLFSMRLWNQMLAPGYTRLAGLCHQAGMKLYMHTCGHLGQHLEPLAACGVDIIDNKQPALWSGSAAVDAVRGRVAFSTCVDIQSRLPVMALDEVAPEADALVRRLATPLGGFIATSYDKPDLALPPENVERMGQAFRRFRW